MNVIESKISKLYIGLVVFLHIMALMVMGISATYLRAIFYTEKRVFAGVLIVFMLAFLIYIWKEILHVKKITLDSRGITVHNFNTWYQIEFSEIDKIQKGKNKIMMRGNIPFTDGYTYTDILLKDGKNLIISPDKFENYSEIMSFINSQVNN